MNNLKTIVLIVIAALLISNTAFADGKRHGKGPGHGDDESGNFKNHFGLSDSCWKAFITDVSTKDTSINVGAIGTAFAANTKKIDSLRNLLDSLSDHKGKRSDSSRLQIKAVINALRTLIVQNDSLKKLTVTIISTNFALFDSIRDNCGKPAKDTTVRDTLNGKDHHRGDNDSTEVGDSSKVSGKGIDLEVSRISPNPAAVGSTLSIHISVSADIDVTLTVSTLLGTQVKLVDLGIVTAGKHTETLDLSGVVSGSYILSIKAGTQTVSRMILIR